MPQDTHPNLNVATIAFAVPAACKDVLTLGTFFQWVALNHPCGKKT